MLVRQAGGHRVHDPDRRPDEEILRALDDPGDFHVVQPEAEGGAQSAQRATASAALDDSPAPGGTADSIRASKPESAWPSRPSVAVTPCT